MGTVFYVGCWGEPGHYMFMGAKHKRSLDFSFTPWGYSVDGGLAPAVRSRRRCSEGVVEREAPQGVCAVHYKKGRSKEWWTAIAFWDRSVDNRPNSGSCFFAKGHHSFDEMVQLATEHYPSIMERFDFELTEDDGAWRSE